VPRMQTRTTSRKLGTMETELWHEAAPISEQRAAVAHFHRVYSYIRICAYICHAVARYIAK